MLFPFPKPEGGVGGWVSLAVVHEYSRHEYFGGFGGKSKVRVFINGSKKGEDGELKYPEAVGTKALLIGGPIGRSKGWRGSFAIRLP